MENFIFVEMTVPPYKAGDVAEMLDGGRRPELLIGSVIRSYTSRTRAQEDLALMKEILPTRKFDILVVEHIDN